MCIIPANDFASNIFSFSRIENTRAHKKRQLKIFIFKCHKTIRPARTGPGWSGEMSKIYMFPMSLDFSCQNQRTSLDWSGLVRQNVKKLMMFFKVFGQHFSMVLPGHKPGLVLVSYKGRICAFTEFKQFFKLSLLSTKPRSLAWFAVY
jgi:hypothetical protein